MKHDSTEYRSQNIAFSSRNIFSRFVLYSKFKMLNSNSGFSMLVVLVAFLVLFTTISLLKVGTLENVQPDLRRIGINYGPQASVEPLADDQTTTPLNVTDRTEFSENSNVFSLAVDDLEIDGEIDSEGDNPPYIE